MNKADLVSKRPYHPDDEDFIYATWLRGLYYGNSWFREIDKDAFFQNYHKVIEGILQKPTTQINVACLKETPDVVLAYCVYRDDIVHWVYCKKDWRGIKLSQDLMPERINIFTHLTSSGKMIKPKHVVFNPFAI